MKSFVLTLCLMFPWFGFSTTVDRWEQPLPISLIEFKKYSEKKLKRLFGPLQGTPQIQALDGWVRKDDVFLLDYAAVIYTNDLSPDFTFSEDFRVALILGARGSEDILLLKRSNQQWIPYSWQFALIFKEKSSPSKMKTIHRQIRAKYPRVRVSILENVKLMTFSVGREDDVGYRVSQTEARQLIEAYKELLHHKHVKSLEPATFVYTIPFAFSDVVTLSENGEVDGSAVFDLNAFRSVSREAKNGGAKFTTEPDFKRPFGEGPRYSKP